MAVLSDEPTFVGMFVAGHASFKLPTSVHDVHAFHSGSLSSFVWVTRLHVNPNRQRSSFPWPKLHLEN